MAEFKESEFNGNGILVRFNGDKYVGGFKDNLFHGQGMLRFTDSKGKRQILVGAWDQGHYAENQEDGVAPGVDEGKPDEEYGEVLSPEVVLFYQYQMMTDLMSDLAPSRPGVTDLYLVSFGATVPRMFS